MYAVDCLAKIESNSFDYYYIQRLVTMNNWLTLPTPRVSISANERVSVVFFSSFFHCSPPIQNWLYPFLHVYYIPNMCLQFAVYNLLCAQCVSVYHCVSYIIQNVFAYFYNGHIVFITLKYFEVIYSRAQNKSNICISTIQWYTHTHTHVQHLISHLFRIGFSI